MNAPVSHLPAMGLLRAPRREQPAPPPVDALLDEALAPLRELELAGQTVAVAVGSRGIANLPEIVQRTCAALEGAGASVFLIPAMGSHGGGTAEGQAQVLADLGVVADPDPIPVRSSLQTRHLGETSAGVAVHLDAEAMAADWIYPIGRVKPHTSITGRHQSGLVKLLVVGAGKVDGARAFHRATLDQEASDVLAEMFEVVLRTARVLGGLAIVEDGQHRTARLEHLDAAHIVRRERELLDLAASLMPRLPVERLDVLIVDRIGKNISGTGMDPNVTGRRFRLNARWQEQSPSITRIVALDLTPESHGNATGIGLADMVGPRLLAAMDDQATFLNAVTSLNTIVAHIPLHFPTDREAIELALRSVGLDASETRTARVLHVSSTLDLDVFEASEALVADLVADGFELEHPVREMTFTPDGSLMPISL